ncbi:hypothetical protein BU17DRAFT_99311 [Hysterangium stoloniferum]|nr:hypothetical protein BU17DRAFT_99311 [Hysterangium stoloniferum]
MADIAGLPPMVTPSAAVTIPNSQLSDERKRAVKAYKMLHEQWGCDEPGSDLCLQGNHYIAHIQLSQEQISIWIDEICRGQATYHHPPEVFIIPDSSRPNRNLNFDWGASETNTDPEVEIGTGQAITLWANCESLVDLWKYWKMLQMSICTMPWNNFARDSRSNAAILPTLYSKMSIQRFWWVDLDP